MSTVPKSVPKAIVDTGTSARHAPRRSPASSSRAHGAGSRRTAARSAPAAAASPASSQRRLVSSAIAVSDVKIASPIAVASASSQVVDGALAPARGRWSAAPAWSRVPAKDTRPRLIRAGRTSTNSLAAVCIASNRLGLDVGGLHRQRHVDRHASPSPAPAAPAPRCWAGPATATSAPSPSATSPKARCRRQPGRLGTSEPSSATLVNRAAYACRRRCSTHVERRPARRRRAARAATAGPGRSSGGTPGCRRGGGRRRTGRRPSASPGRCAAAGARRPPGAAPRRSAGAARRRPAANRRAHLGVAGRHLQGLPGLRVDDGQQPDVGAARAPAGRRPRWPAARAGPTARAAAAPSRRVAQEVRDHAHQPAPARRAAQRLQRRGQVAPASALGPRGGRRPAQHAGRRPAGPGSAG